MLVHVTHLPEEVGHHHVWEGLGPSGDLGRAKAGVTRKPAFAVARLGQQSLPARGGRLEVLGSPALRAEDGPLVGIWFQSQLWTGPGGAGRQGLGLCQSLILRGPCRADTC